MAPGGADMELGVSAARRCDSEVGGVCVLYVGSEGATRVRSGQVRLAWRCDAM